MCTLKPLQTLKAHEERVWCVAWNPQGTLLASCGGDKEAKIWGKEGDELVCNTILEGAHKRTIRSVSWSPCGNWLATASFDGTTSLWSKRAGFECTSTLEGHENEVKSAVWSCSGHYIATCSRDKSVWIWEAGEDDEDLDDLMCASVISSHTQDVKRLKWHPTKEVLASASYDDTVKLYRDDGDNWITTATLKSHQSTVWSLSFDKTGSHLATVSDDLTLKIWREYLPGNPQGLVGGGSDPLWKCVCTVSGYHTRPIYDVDWCHLTGFLATACGDDAVRVFREDLSTGDPDQPSVELCATVDKAHDGDVNCIAWSPTEAGLLASGGDDGQIRLYKLTNFDT